jgi:hypothetical protein
MRICWGEVEQAIHLPQPQRIRTGGTPETRPALRPGPKRCCIPSASCALLTHRAGGFIVETPGELRAGDSGRNELTNLATIMKKLDVPQSGKIGSTVSVNTRYGQIQRQYIIPKDPHAPDQVRIRSNLGRISARWRTLTPEQRFAWMARGRHASTRSRLGTSAHLSGCQFFIKINCARAAIGADYLVNPPPDPNFGLNPVGDL